MLLVFVALRLGGARVLTVTSVFNKCVPGSQPHPLHADAQAAALLSTNPFMPCHTRSHRLVTVAIGSLVGSTVLRPSTPFTAACIIAVSIIFGIAMLMNAGYAYGLLHPKPTLLYADGKLGSWQHAHAAASVQSPCTCRHCHLPSHVHAPASINAHVAAATCTRTRQATYCTTSCAAAC